MKITVRESRLWEMATVNLDDRTRGFSCDSYIIKVWGSPREHFSDKIPHVHVSHIQDGWEIRMSFDGHYISTKRWGNRPKTDKFVDIERLFRKWLPQKSVTYPEITNYVRIQRAWNEANPDKRIVVQDTL